MARIIYALSGQGRGHASRVMAISNVLRRRSHEIIFCGGGTAKKVLASQGERVLDVPALRQMMECNEVQVKETLSYNGKLAIRLPQIVARLADEFSDYRPDLVITDFEAFAPRAAQRIGVPVLSFNHQEVVTETRYRLPSRYWLNAALAYTAIKLIVPRNPEHILLTSFFFPPVKHPEYTTLVPPIIRPAVQALSPTNGDHVLVYYNQSEGAEHVLEALAQVQDSFILYNFDPPAPPHTYPNLQFKEPSLEGFLNDLATSRAVICTAGFTLMSEALCLGKPLLVVPNRGIFEQTLNALFLEREGLGEALLDQPLTTERVSSFLDQSARYEARMRNRPACGNDQAIACIEKVLSKIRPPVHSIPTLPYESAMSNEPPSKVVTQPE